MHDCKCDVVVQKRGQIWEFEEKFPNKISKWDKENLIAGNGKMLIIGLGPFAVARVVPVMKVINASVLNDSIILREGQFYAAYDRIRTVDIGDLKSYVCEINDTRYNAIIDKIRAYFTIGFDVGSIEGYKYWTTIEKTSKKEAVETKIDDVKKTISPKSQPVKKAVSPKPLVETVKTIANDKIVYTSQPVKKVDITKKDGKIITESVAMTIALIAEYDKLLRDAEAPRRTLDELKKNVGRRDEIIKKIKELPNNEFEGLCNGNTKVISHMYDASSSTIARIRSHIKSSVR